MDGGNATGPAGFLRQNFLAHSAGFEKRHLEYWNEET
jgi:hypothetical protein